jgi:hypothetical protein
LYNRTANPLACETQEKVVITRKRYQSGCLYRERRRAGPDAWVFRYRDGQVNGKVNVGTAEQYRTRSAAMKAVEELRAKINRETRSPRTIAELVSHYREEELTKRQHKVVRYEWIEKKPDSIRAPVGKEGTSARRFDRGRNQSSAGRTGWALLRHGFSRRCHGFAGQ